jgi:hypothetical protein
MSKEITEEHHIIYKFREMVNKRYLYADLIIRFQLSPCITEQVVEEVKAYFLETIYPPAQKRYELEDAFKELATYMKQPKKIWGLFGNMAGAILKFGRHFIQALKAGFASLDSFIGAKNFEKSLANLANKLGIEPNMSDEEFEDCIYQLPREEIEQFIKDVHSLFGAMTNTKLLEKTISILDNVVETMKSKPNTYPSKDVDGILLGRELLKQGLDLFSKYDEDTKKEMVAFIYKNEMWFIDQVYQKKENKF